MPLRIVIADDHPLVRDGLAAVLDRLEGFEVVGHAGDGELATALRSVSSGQAVFGAGVAARLLSLAVSPADAAAYPFPTLTERERSILELLAAGSRTADIASALFLSPKTVSNQLTTIFAKLGVCDRTSAVIRAREHGLGAPGDAR